MFGEQHITRSPYMDVPGISPARSFPSSQQGSINAADHHIMEHHMLDSPAQQLVFGQFPQHVGGMIMPEGVEITRTDGFTSPQPQSGFAMHQQQYCAGMQAMGEGMLSPSPRVNLSPYPQQHTIPVVSEFQTGCSYASISTLPPNLNHSQRSIPVPCVSMVSADMTLREEDKGLHDAIMHGIRWTVQESHSQVMEAVTNVVVKPPDLTGILNALSGIASAISGVGSQVGAQGQVLQAMSGRLELLEKSSLFGQKYGEVGSRGIDSDQRVQELSEINGRLQNLEELLSTTAGSPSVNQVRTELRTALVQSARSPPPGTARSPSPGRRAQDDDDFKKTVQAECAKLQTSLQKDMADLKKKMEENTGTQGQTFQRELRKLQQSTSDSIEQLAIPSSGSATRQVSRPRSESPRLDKGIDIEDLSRRVAEKTVAMQSSGSATRQVSRTRAESPMPNKGIDVEDLSRRVAEKVAAQVGGPASRQVSRPQSESPSRESSEKAVDLEDLSRRVAEKVRKSALSVDLSPVLKALGDLPTVQKQISSIHQKIMAANFSQDSSDTRAVGKVKAAQDPADIAAAISKELKQLKVAPDSSEIATAVSKELKKVVPDSGAIATAVSKELKQAMLKVDSSDVLQAIKKINVEPDVEALGAAILKKMQKVNLSVDSSEVLTSVKAVSTSNLDVLTSVKAISNSNSEVLAGVKALSASNSEVLAGLKAMPVQLEDIVYQKMKKVAMKLEAELSSKLEGINVEPRQAANAVDFSPILDAIGQIEMQVTVKGSSEAGVSRAKSFGTRTLADASGQQAPSPRPPVAQVATRRSDTSTSASGAPVTPSETAVATRRSDTSTSASGAWVTPPDTAGTRGSAKVSSGDVALSETSGSRGGSARLSSRDTNAEKQGTSPPREATKERSRLASPRATRGRGCQDVTQITTEEQPSLREAQIVSSPTRGILRNGNEGSSHTRSVSTDGARRVSFDSTNLTLRPSLSGTPSVEGAEEGNLCCKCGYSCGTSAALEKHLARFEGQRGHAAVRS